MSEDPLLSKPEIRAELTTAYEQGRKSKAISAGIEKSELKALYIARFVLFSSYAFVFGVLFGAIVF